MSEKLVCPCCGKSLKINPESWPYVFFWAECNSSSHVIYLDRKTAKGLVKAWYKAFGGKNEG